MARKSILILADLTSPLMEARIKMLENLPYKKYILHNANNQPLKPQILESYANFIILEHPKINSIKIRYLYSFFYTFYLLATLNPKLIVVHWASRLYQNIPLSLWGKRVIVHTMGGDINKEEDCYGKKKFFTALLFKRARVITAKTNVMLEILRANFPFVRLSKLAILSWGVEERFFTPINETQKKQNQREILGGEYDFVFFSIRTFNPYHFQREILEQFIKSFQHKGNKVAMLVSILNKNEAYFKECKNLFKNPHIYARSISHKDMDKAIKMCDCIISYKLCDGISQSLMEGVSAKKWVIANRLKNHEMLLSHKQNAYLVEDIAELPQAFDYVLQNEVKYIQNAMLLQSKQQEAYLLILSQHYGVIMFNNSAGGGVILILADLTSPLMEARIKMLENLPYKKYILHNANNKPLNPQILKSYANFTILEHPKINSIKIRYLYSFFYTFYLLATLNPKLIVVHWASRLYQNIPLSLWGKRVIVHTMGGDIDLKQDYWGKKKFFVDRLLRAARVISVKSAFMQEMLSHNAWLKHKIVILSWGVEERFFKPITLAEKKALQYKLFGRTFEFLFFSIRSLKPFYRQREIIESFVKYFGDKPNIGLLLPEFGKDSVYFKGLLDSLSPNIFIHNIPHSQMHNYLFAVDCVISYSKSDGISQSLMEAICAKRWIIANKLPNHSMLLKHRENAYLLDDIGELQEAFISIQGSILKPYYDKSLDSKVQKRLYLSVLKEYFNVA